MSFTTRLFVVLVFVSFSVSLVSSFNLTRLSCVTPLSCHLCLFFFPIICDSTSSLSFFLERKIQKGPNSMLLLLHLHLLSIVCLEMLTFHKGVSLVFNLLFTIWVGWGPSCAHFTRVGASPILWEHWALPNRSISLVPQLQNTNKCAATLMAHRFSLCTWESWTKPYGIERRCYWGHLWEPHGNMMGTRGKNPKHSPPFKEKIWPSWLHAELSHWLHETSMSRSVCHHFWPTPMGGARRVWDIVIVWFILISSWVAHNFFFVFWKGPHWLAHHLRIKWILCFWVPFESPFGL